jgi:hypothetical protein
MVSVCSEDEPHRCDRIDRVLKRNKHRQSAIFRDGLIWFGSQGGQDWLAQPPSLAGDLRAMGVDIKVVQELLRHANIRTTLEIYTYVVSAQYQTATNYIDTATIATI